MDFSLTPEEEAFREKVRVFAENVIKPTVNTLEASEEFPMENVKRMAELGDFIIGRRWRGGWGVALCHFVGCFGQFHKRSCCPVGDEHRKEYG